MVVQMVKNLPAMQETQDLSLGQDDALEKGMATHCSILAWRNPWTVESGRLQLLGSQRVRHDLATEHTHLSTHQHRSSLDLWVKTPAWLLSIPFWNSLWVLLEAPRGLTLPTNLHFHSFLLSHTSKTASWTTPLAETCTPWQTSCEVLGKPLGLFELYFHPM